MAIAITYGILLITITIWVAFEIWRAPLVDGNEKIVRPEKKLKDLFKPKK